MNRQTTRTVLITGASKGIGLALSHKLAAKNYVVIGIARSKPKSDFPGTFYECDLNQINETQELLHLIKNTHQIDIIVNNVGIALPEPLGQIQLDSLKTVYDLNVRTAVQITQFFVASMKEKQWGRIINISSRAIFGARDRSSYAAAKCALVGLTKTWALELAEYNITVNSVAPGPTETEMFRKARPVGSPGENDVLAMIPMKRLGKPDEIAVGIEFLVADEASFITGQVICIDGGSSL